MSIITFHCRHCGSAEIVRDAWAEWHETAQAWVLGSVFDAAYCNACDADTTLTETVHADSRGIALGGQPATA